MIGSARQGAFAPGLLLALLAAAGAGCAGGPALPVASTDAAVYREPQDPAAAAAWQRAQAALATGEVAQALPDLTVAVERSPDLVRAHLAYQDVARAIGGPVEATMRGFYRDLPDRDSPVPAYVRARLADTSYAKGKVLQEILAKYRTFGWAHLSLGRVRRGQGQLLLAVDAFRAATSYDPSLHEARFERAGTLEALGRLEEAAVDYEAYLRERPDDYVAMREYVVMLVYRLVRVDRSLELLSRLEAVYPQDLDLRMHRGAALWRASRPREALTHYLAVLDADPNAARAALNIGLIYYDAMPKNQSEPERRLWWPLAARAFRYFLSLEGTSEGQETFERTLAVPFRLGVIEDLLGAAPAGSITVDDLRLPQR